MQKSVTVIIPTLNSLDYVDSLFNSLKNQTRRIDRIIVLDSESTDGSEKLWSQLGCEVIQVSRNKFDHGGTRNLGARLVDEGGIVCFFTQDAVLAHSQVVSELISPIEKSQAAAVYGRQLPRLESSNMERYARFAQYLPYDECRTKSDILSLGVRAFRFTNVCSAISLDKFWSVGGFPERTILNEDMLLVAKLFKVGEKVCYSARAEVVHSHDYTIKQQFKRNFDIGVSFEEAKSLLNNAKTSGAGLNFAIGAMKYLYRMKAWKEMPGALADLGARWTGFQLGKRHTLLPLPLKKKLSMHSYHWDRKEQGTL